jgi:hypothetical protein
MRRNRGVSIEFAMSAVGQSRRSEGTPITSGTR